MTAAYVMIALVVGVLVGATIVLVAMRSQGQSATGQILDQVQRIGAVFTHPAHRGRAGEIALENLLEASGMGQHRDFDVQITLPDGGRPDVVLNLPGRGRLVIDAKFPLDDFQRAASAVTEAERRRALAAHGKAVAMHVTDLAQRDYPSQLPDGMDFVVCFVPSEELLAAAYEARPPLFYDAARDHVLLAGPASLLAILWGIAHGCQQELRARNAHEIGESVAELHRRLGTLVPPLQKLGHRMTTAVSSYNELLDSLERRVIPQVRRFESLVIIGPGTQLPEVTTLDAQIRTVDVDRYPAVRDSGTGEQSASAAGDLPVPPPD
jgi:DNA recombination protein RmuC